MGFCETFIFIFVSAGPVSAVGSASPLAFGNSLVRVPGLAHSFTSCQLLVKGLALSIGHGKPLRLRLPRCLSRTLSKKIKQTNTFVPSQPRDEKIMGSWLQTEPILISYHLQPRTHFLFETKLIYSYQIA